MNTVKVLVEGYAMINKDGSWDATSSTTLIDTGKIKIIADPGCNRDLLFSAMKSENLEFKDIDYVFISHYHLDHCALMGIFDQATIFDSAQWQKGSLGGDLKDNILPGTDIEIVETPGHTFDHASLLVPTNEGKVLTGADVFWWRNDEEQKIDTEKFDDFASDMDLIKESRKKVLGMADFIIPGHGKMFKVIK